MTTRARREREKEERRQSILRAAREVFFKRGFHRATVDNVAERAEVSKGTIYLYFESKECLLAHLLLDGLTQLSDRLGRTDISVSSETVDERLRRLAHAYRDFFEQEPQYFRLLMAMDRGRFQETVTPEVYQEVLRASLEVSDLAVRIIQHGVDDGLFRCYDARRAAVVLWSTLNGLLELTAHPLRREMIGVDSKSLYQSALDIFVHGLQATPQSKEVRE